MKSVLKACGLILFGLVIALAPIEIVLRVAGGGGPAELDPTFDRSPYGYVPDPDRLNPWVGRDGAALRVAIIGDSFTAGFSNQWDDTYPRRLERLLNLNADALPAEVRIYARNGTSTWQQLGFLNQAIEDGSDLIILGLFGNDTRDHHDVKVAEWEEKIMPRVPRGWKLKLLRGSRSLAWIYMRYDSVRRYRTSVAFQDYAFDPEYSGFKRFEVAVRKFANKTRRNDIPLVAVIWPSMGGLGPGYGHHLVHERFRQVLEKAKIPSLDLLNVFSDKSSLRLSAYPDIDVHPNEIGHRIGANAIFEFLLDNDHIDSSYRPRSGRVANRNYWLTRTRRIRSPLYPLRDPKKVAPKKARGGSR